MGHFFMSFEVSAAREQFPALRQQDNGRTPIFLDNPGGTQVPQSVIDAMTDYFRHSNANSGGRFATSRRTDAIKQAAREASAAFVNASNSQEVIFGANMTSLTLSFSRAWGRTVQPGDEIIVTQMDHDANIAPWLLLAEDRGLTVRWVRLDVEDGTLDLHSYHAALNEKTRLVCVGYAANALGTINPVKAMAQMAHEAGAQIFVDAVQAAPHLLIDVQEMDVDFLACSAYKFYGPHLGILYGKADLMEALRPYKVRPASDQNPGKWETGTPNFEALAGTKAAIDYIASFGTGATLRERLCSSYEQVRQHENALAWQLIDGLKRLPGVEIRGIVDPARAGERVPTVVFRLADHHPGDMEQQLADEAIYVWSGDHYALETMRALNHQDDGGMVRIGIAHYNDAREIQRTLEVLNGKYARKAFRTPVVLW
jgi:cysteine desulfurase family protein (TIGR01976 family)